MDNEIRMAMLCQDHRKDGIRVLQDDAAKDRDLGTWASCNNLMREVEELGERMVDVALREFLLLLHPCAHMSQYFLSKPNFQYPLISWVAATAVLSVAFLIFNTFFKYKLQFFTKYLLVFSSSSPCVFS